MNDLKASERRFRVPGAARLKRRALPGFFRSLAAMLNTGMPIGSCLRSLESQQSNRHMRAAVLWLRMDMEKGSGVAESMRQFPSLFDAAMCGMIHAGEVSGRLPEIFQQIAGMLESEYALRRRIQLALLYPAVVLLMATALVIFMAAFVLPVFSGFYDSLDIKLPGPTLALLAFMQWARVMAVPIAAGVVVFVVAVKLTGMTAAGRYALDWLKLSAPVAGMLFRRTAVARLARVLASLIKAGVMPAHALEITAEAMTNSVLAGVLKKARGAVEAGRPLSAGLAGERFIPVEFVEMIRTGEQSGRTDEMLETAAGYYEADATSIGTIISIISAVLVTIVIGLVVGGIAVAVLMPLLQLPGEIH